MPSIGWRSPRNQARSSLPAMPASRDPGSGYQGASARASISPKKSASMISAPARWAACASARPESARMRMAMRALSTARNELARQGEGLAEIDELGLGALMETPEQLPLEAEFHIADSERTDPYRGLADGYAVRLCRKSLDAGRRNGIRVGGHLQAPCRFDLVGREHLDAGPCGDEYHVGFGEGCAPAGLGAAVSHRKALAEPLLELRGLLGHHWCFVVADQRHLGARLGRDHAYHAAHHALRSERGDFRALEPATGLAEL